MLFQNQGCILFYNFSRFVFFNDLSGLFSFSQLFQGWIRYNNYSRIVYFFTTFSRLYTFHNFCILFKAFPGLYTFSEIFQECILFQNLSRVVYFKTFPELHDVQTKVLLNHYWAENFRMEYPKSWSVNWSGD